MRAFFASFSGFTHNPTETPEQNFHRLHQSQIWSEATYSTHRRQFLDALLKDTDSPVHRFFITQHPDFLIYNSDFSPRLEFDRLCIFKNWIDNGLDEPARARFGEALREELNNAFEPEGVTLQEQSSGALDTYYSNYPNFLYNPQQPPMMEFQRLMQHQHWGPRDEAYERARAEFFEAFAEEFASYFGSDQVDITSWQQLCEDLGVEPIPATITQCRKRLQQLNVNIYDLLHFKRTGAAFELFPTVKELRKYTKQKKLIFPKAKAKEGPLRFLLRDIFGGRSATVN
ncbi:hypothetical protein DFP73DRAFT_178054 [Morchella snyderi]|nr:hypothetical protein DFP73DRAFT_178054 [Morchella snyderi]